MLCSSGLYPRNFPRLNFLKGRNRHVSYYPSYFIVFDDNDNVLMTMVMKKIRFMPIDEISLQEVLEIVSYCIVGWEGVTAIK